MNTRWKGPEPGGARWSSTRSNGTEPACAQWNGNAPSGAQWNGVPLERATNTRPDDVGASTPARIRAVCERNVKLLELRPDRGHLKARTRARIEGGLRCEIREGPWTLTADMPAKAGGHESAPTPGMLGRGALASCLAMGIVMWAARLDVPLDSVDVEVETDFDARGELGLGDVPAGYRSVRRVVSIESPADHATLRALVDEAEAHSPYLDVFGRPQAMQRVLRLNGAED